MKDIKLRKLRKKPLKNILVKWLTGAIDEREARDRAELIRYYYRCNQCRHTKCQYQSILEEALCLLDSLHFDLITVEDIPEFIKFIDTDPGSCQDAWRDWKKYWEKVDFEARKKQLADNLFYITN